MPIQIIRDLDELRVFQQDWDRLAAGVPSTSYTWMDAWWSAYGGRDCLHVAISRDSSGTVIGIAPWYLSKQLGLRKLKFLGSGKVCSDYVQLLIQPGCEQFVFRELSQEIQRLAQSPMFTGCEFEGVVQGEAWNSCLKDLLPATFDRLDHELESCWQVNLPETWDSHLAILNKSFRRKVRKCLERIDEGLIQVKTIKAAKEWKIAEKILSELHGVRRNSMGDQGCFADHRFGQFLERAIPAMLEQGQATVRWLEASGTPIAIGLFLIGPRYIGMYQSGVDPNAMDLEPGHTLSAFAIREAVQNGIKTFDFMRGNESYKSLWRAQPIALTKTTVVSPNLLARGLATGEASLRIIKQQYKQLGSRGRVAEVVAPINSDSPTES